MRTAIVKIGEASRGEEALAHEADRSLDAPFLIAARDGQRTRREAIPGRQFQQCGMEADRIRGTLEMHPLEHGAAQIVIQQGTRYGLAIVTFVLIERAIKQSYCASS